MTENFPPDIVVTSRLNLLDLVRRKCVRCSHVVIPPGAEDEPDIYRCKAAAGRHCVTIVGTNRCDYSPLSEEIDEP